MNGKICVESTQFFTTRSTSTENHTDYKMPERAQTKESGGQSNYLCRDQSQSKKKIDKGSKKGLQSGPDSTCKHVEVKAKPSMCLFSLNEI